MVDNILIDSVVSLGYSEYEAKAYASLVGAHPVSAYELAHLASVPTSKIYGVLAKLEEQGLVSVSEQGKKKRYIPLDPDEFIGRSRSRIDNTLMNLERGFRSLRKGSELSSVWNIHEMDWFLDKTERMIRNAETAVFLSIWGEEYELCYPWLVEAQSRGVMLSTVHFGKPERSCGQLFAHPIEETLYAERGGRGFTLVVDSREALIATIYPEERLEAACGLAPGFVTLAEDYIKHDVYLMKIVARFDPLLIERFGEGYTKLRDVFSDEEVGHENLD